MASKARTAYPYCAENQKEGATYMPESRKDGFRAQRLAGAKNVNTWSSRWAKFNRICMCDSRAMATAVGSRWPRRRRRVITSDLPWKRISAGWYPGDFPGGGQISAVSMPLLMNATRVFSGKSHFHHSHHHVPFITFLLYIFFFPHTPLQSISSHIVSINLIALHLQYIFLPFYPC